MRARQSVTLPRRSIWLTWTGPLVFEALDSNEPDYEDGLIRGTAEALQVDAIISYDKKAFRSSFVPKLTAGEALSLFDEQS